MPTHKPNTLDAILYGTQEIEARAEHHAPSSATLLVSLFLILITFFVVMNRNANPDAAKRKVVFESMKNKFGHPADELETFGTVVQPKIDAFTTKLEKILGDDAIVESTLDGMQTKVTFSKELFFYADETEIRADKLQIAQKISAVLKQLKGERKLGIAIIAQNGNFKLDYQKLAALKNAIGITEAEIGLTTEAGNSVTLYIDNE